MTYDQLKALDAIITKGSFQAASESLHRSQPAISAAIKNLEEEFEIQLFSREQYRAVLTSQGEAFYQKAKLALEQMTHLETLGKKLGMGIEPEIRVAMSMLCPLPKFLEICRESIKRFPLTRFSLSIEYLGGVERLRKKEFDITINPIDDIESSPDLEVMPLMTVPMVTVAAPSFLPTQTQHKLTDTEMREYPQVIIRDTSPYSSNPIKGVLTGGRSWSVSDHFSKKQITLAGLGWGQLPQNFIEEELGIGSLIPLKIKSIQTVNLKIYAIR